MDVVNIEMIYRRLFAAYGPQGWWPIFNSRTFEFEYYRDAPRGNADSFEIALGAILTQNISWSNVEKAFAAISRRGLLTPQALHNISADELAVLIKPTGYYNQKVKKINAFLDWFHYYEYDFNNCTKDYKLLRDELLSIRGIGPETADSILLYALKHCSFVVDAYTIRIMKRLGIVHEDDSYHLVQDIIQKNCKVSWEIYNEYHALLVRHAKHDCLKQQPLCDHCCLASFCLTAIKEQ